MIASPIQIKYKDIFTSTHQQHITQISIHRVCTAILRRIEHPIILIITTGVDGMDDNRSIQPTSVKVISVRMEYHTLCAICVLVEDILLCVRCQVP